MSVSESEPRSVSAFGVMLGRWTWDSSGPSVDSDADSDPDTDSDPGRLELAGQGGQPNSTPRKQGRLPLYPLTPLALCPYDRLALERGFALTPPCAHSTLSFTFTSALRE
jgi:hypothetical protein